MIRLRNIRQIKVSPREIAAGELTVRCLNGQAKWSAESRILSLKAEVIDDEAQDQWVAFLAATPPPFDLYVTYHSESTSGTANTCRFKNCIEAALELRSGTVRATGPATNNFYLKAMAELDA